jgi:hypothetical protein
MTSKATILALLMGIAMVGLNVSVPAQAAGSTAITETSAPVSKTMQFAQRPYDPSAGSVGFKKKAKKKKAKK